MTNATCGRLQRIDVGIAIDKFQQAAIAVAFLVDTGFDAVVTTSGGVARGL